MLDYVESNWRAGDTLYVHHAAQYALLYYSECNCRADDDPWRFTGSRGRDQFTPVLVPVSGTSLLAHMRARPGSLPISGTSEEGQRVWFLYTHVQSNTEKAFIRQRLIGRLDEIGERLAGIDRTGAHAYLYRFGN